MQRSYYPFFFFLMCCAFGVRQTYAQDPQYSQYYAAPLFLNPAFTGAEQVTRIGFNYRNQWPGLDASFTTFSAYIDGYLDDYNSGIGLMFMQDTEGFVNLRSTSVGAFYAYELRLGEGMYFRPAPPPPSCSGTLASLIISFSPTSLTLTHHLTRARTCPIMDWMASSSP
ncbi:PorP/SprF family type IX secretion system membrane protein [Nitritalea halalkaliphila]|uniref:PorP/SprF family type IX secretion system membrane protein n=1 Tax=Nitritalea halalkaliphila TaxID=590849 RepID=UPI0029353021|nr:PorP/SprF family type IX secretion system membrane protein [Nitritalea halalkaliphila]